MTSKTEETSWPVRKAERTWGWRDQLIIYLAGVKDRGHKIS